MPPEEWKCHPQAWLWGGWEATTSCPVLSGQQEGMGYKENLPDQAAYCQQPVSHTPTQVSPRREGGLRPSTEKGHLPGCRALLQPPWGSGRTSCGVQVSRALTWLPSVAGAGGQRPGQVASVVGRGRQNPVTLSSPGLWTHHFPTTF